MKAKATICFVVLFVAVFGGVAAGALIPIRVSEDGFDPFRLSGPGVHTKFTINDNDLKFFDGTSFLYPTDEIYIVGTKNRDSWIDIVLTLSNQEFPGYSGVLSGYYSGFEGDSGTSIDNLYWIINNGDDIIGYRNPLIGQFTIGGEGDMVIGEGNFYDLSGNPIGLSWVPTYDHFGSLSIGPFAYSTATIPEPATIALLALGGLLIRNRRKEG